MNQFNTLHGDEPNEPPRERNNQPPAAHLKSSTSPSKTNPMISAIMGRLNNRAIDNGDVKVPTSDFLVESNFESVTYPYTTTINKLMMMKWIIYCNLSIQNMMKIFWMLTSKYFKLDWWSPLLQIYMQSLMCCYTREPIV